MLTHTATMNLWNHDTDREQRTEVRTFWSDDKAEAALRAAQLADENDGTVRYFDEPRSSLGRYRVVSYRPVAA